ncbi:hypothetical protein RHSIM_Rhsim06G0096400 [Rhododendron simsii]|uniref:NAC domain-containing protein n=1 Tax=Rhododendron simsii TaxID=118357 RepID=A0A834GWK9_RHOSS|nr:hypothetical protein RHSIM_Rhsim06G0096400 [Rhododendron simsii]
MEMESCVPPGFRFHPTEEELVGYYLKRKVNSLKIDLDVIVDIDLYRMEPWDIQGADWDMKSRMSGISLATKIKNTRPELVQIGPLLPDFGRQQGEIRLYFRRTD